MAAKYRILMTILGVMALFGCASHEIKALTPHPIEAYQIRQAVAGVTIAADPYNTKEKVQQAFTLDLSEEGFCPILLVMDNRSNDNILLVKDDIELVDSRGNVLKPTPANVMIEKFEKNKMAYALLGFGIFSYMSAEEANKKMLSDWSGKELPADKILIPNRKAHGVVYFKVGERLTTLPNSTLHIPLRNMRTQEMHSVKLRIAEGVSVPDVERAPSAPK